MYVAVLSGASERPPRQTKGTGMATFRVEGTIARYEVVVDELSGSATVAHLVIGGEQTTVGQVILNLGAVAPSGLIAAGTIDLGAPITFNNSTISGDSLRSLFERGTAFVNVYTTAYPVGEVRGQVIRRDP
ncbi:MAG: CHRD domain-containing protein [Gemmatimonadaceae bacterium]